MDGTLSEQRDYNAADQVVGWTYDAAGNLLSDGTTTYAYDALGRLTSTTHNGTSTTHAYNGDGVLVAQTTGSTTTRYTQDLVAPLSQILQTTHGTQRTDYVYGHERLLALHGTAQTWYGSDALGSVRLTLDATGAPLTALHYDPWGTPQGSVQPPTFGFTGELQADTSGLVHLRARWYQPQYGRFTSRDPFIGYDSEPSSLHQYLYVGLDPINRVDPSGLYWWGPGQALWEASDKRLHSANVHVRIQAIMMEFRMDQVHAEYPIPPTGMKVDLLDSVSGDVWEIKPWDDAAQAEIDLAARLAALEAARQNELLTGINPVSMPYNWNFAPPVWRRGITFPTTDLYIGTDDTGHWDIYATQAQPGIILWWKHKRGRRVQVPDPVLLPRHIAFGKRNQRTGWRPNLAPVPPASYRPNPGMAMPIDDLLPDYLLPISLGVGALEAFRGGGGGRLCIAR
ncbi:RHS repeat domain-containing protein [Kallotenue papyrolyticum]|uniref:RHS repeat domain-containing protein n=1 Tax=Kallotenue papyrolyticum TaxID=1325125 RepID=UPI0013774DD8|nr:RHS repeat-associated core domain-containing protein [Kallotenue papyrolyticum]